MRRITFACIAIVAFTAGMSWVAVENAILWQRVSVSTLDRYANDIAMPDIPSRLSGELLRPLCIEKSAFPGCLESAQQADMNNGLDTLELIRAQFVDAIEKHLELANQISAIPANHEGIQKHHELAAKQIRSGQSLLETLGNWASSEFTQEEGPTDKHSLFQLQAELKVKQALTRQKLETENSVFANPQSSPEQKWKSVLNLGLLGSGLRIEHSFIDFPATVILMPARDSLAARLEWLRRGKENAHDHAAQRTLEWGLPAIAISGAIALLTSIAININPLPIAAISLLLAAGYQMLMDLALSGAEHFRNIPLRQFSPSLIPLGHDQSIPIYPPLIVFAAILLFLRLTQTGVLERIWWPVDRWISISSAKTSVISGLALLAITTMLVTISGYSASISELVIFVAAVAVASFIARQAAPAELDGYKLLVHSRYTLPTLSLGTLAACMACASRGDLGHLMVTSVLVAGFLFIFWGNGWRIFISVLTCLCLYLLFEYRENGSTAITGTLVAAISEAKPHLGQRLSTFHDAFNHGPSDLARIIWLMSSAGTNGWGTGWVPWSGFPGSSSSQGLPLQAPSDYASSILISIWGWRGWCLLTLWFALFCYLFSRGIGIALGTGTNFRHRFLAATGAIGCLAILVKGLLSITGCLRLFPLTGVPIALLSYGPTAIWAALVYTALSLMTPNRQAHGYLP